MGNTFLSLWVSVIIGFIELSHYFSDLLCVEFNAASSQVILKQFKILVHLLLGWPLGLESCQTALVPDPGHLALTLERELPGGSHFASVGRLD